MPHLPIVADGSLVIDIDVGCHGDRTSGWTCHVALSEDRREVSRHDVRVSATDLDRLGRGASEPTDLVRRSFAFLLEREPPSSILRSFDLPVIGRYFPEYEPEIRRSPGAG